MKRIKILSLFTFTFVAILFLNFSHISMLYNLAKLIFVLIHFTFVVFITDWLLHKSETETRKEIAWIVFGVSFVVTAFIGSFLFPTEELGRLFFTEPFLLIASIFSVFGMQSISKAGTDKNKTFLRTILIPLILAIVFITSGLFGRFFYIISIFSIIGYFAIAWVLLSSISYNVNKSHIQNKKGLIEKFHLITILSIIFFILIIGSIFIPLLNNLVIDEGGYLHEANINNAIVPENSQTNKWNNPVLRYFDATLTNPLPFPVYYPIDSGVRVCTFSKNRELLHSSGLIFRPNYFIEGVTNQWSSNDASRLLPRDSASSFYSFWHSTKRSNGLLRIPPFSSRTLEIGIALRADKSEVGSVRLFHINPDGTVPDCNSPNPYKVINYI